MNIIRDPETGFYNSCHAGTYAVGPRRGLISFVTPHSHIIMNKYREMGIDKMPIAFVLGVPPAVRDHGEFLRSAHGYVGRDGDGRHHHGPRFRDGAVRDARPYRAGGGRDRGRGRHSSWPQIRSRRCDLAVDVSPAASRFRARGRDHRTHHARRPADLSQPPDLSGHRPSDAAAALSRGGALQPPDRDRTRREGRALPDLGRRAVLHPPVRLSARRASSTTR